MNKKYELDKYYKMNLTNIMKVVLDLIQEGE